MGYKTFGRRRSLRLQQYDYRTSRPIHVTFGTYRKRPLLADREFVNELIAVLRESATESQMTIYAYCFMPDHAHFLLAPQGKISLVEFIQGYKGRTAHLFLKRGGQGKLWQRGFYDHVLRDEEDLRTVARYILENPVRKGLVDDFRAYPGSGSLVFSLDDL